MPIDAVLSCAEVYNVEKLKVPLASVFTLYSDFPGDVRWAGIVDRVLTITERGNEAEVQAAEIGEAEIWAVGADDIILKKIHIIVVNTLNEAVILNGIVEEIIYI